MSDESVAEADEIPFSQAAITAALRTRWLGHPLTLFESVDSTNVVAQAQAAVGAPHGSVFLANEQTAGRGRLGRRWVAPAGSALLLSLLLRPNWSTERAAWLTMLLGVAACRAIAAETGVSASLKWPNDVVVEQDGIAHKLGGILVETALQNDRIAHAICGMGLNVNLTTADLPQAHTPPTSLRLLTGTRVDRAALLITLLTELEMQLDAAAAGQSPHALWNERLVTRNRQVTVTQMGRPPLQGVAQGVDVWGRLELRLESGDVVAIPAGDVTLRNPD